MEVEEEEERVVLSVKVIKGGKEEIVEVWCGCVFVCVCCVLFVTG